VCISATARFGVWGCIYSLIAIQLLRTLLVFIASQRTAPLHLPVRTLLLLMTGLAGCALVASTFAPPVTVYSQLSLFVLFLLTSSAFMALYIQQGALRWLRAQHAA